MFVVLLAALGLAPFSAGDPVLPPPLRQRAAHVFSLKPELDARLARYGSRAWRTGVAVYSCSRDSLVYGSGENQPLSPASCQKLLTTACALDHWDSTLVRQLDARLDST